MRNPPGNFSKTFEVDIRICFQPRFKEILGADGYDVGIPRAFPASGVCSGMHDWTTSNDVTFWVKTRPCSKHVLESRMAVASFGDARWEKVG